MRRLRRVPVHGLTISTPVAATSRTLRVTSARLCASAVAAISVGTAGNDHRADNSPHIRAMVRSTGSTFSAKSCSVSSTHFSNRSAPSGSRPRLAVMPFRNSPRVNTLIQTRVWEALTVSRNVTTFRLGRGRAASDTTLVSRRYPTSTIRNPPPAPYLCPAQFRNRPISGRSADV